MQHSSIEISARMAETLGRSLIALKPFEWSSNASNKGNLLPMVLKIFESLSASDSRLALRKRQQHRKWLS